MEFSENDMGTDCSGSARLGGAPEHKRILITTERANVEKHISCGWRRTIAHDEISSVRTESSSTVEAIGTMKTKGIISASRNMEDWMVPELLRPFFFIGLRLDNKPNSTIHKILWSDDPLDWPAVEKELKISTLKEGQFFIDHEFAGHSCAHAEMFGALLPLKLSGRQDIANGLIEKIAKYDFDLANEFDKAVPDFMSLGLHIYDQYLDGKIRYDQALLKIADADKGIAFLRQNEFRYVTGIGGMSNAEFAERTKALGLSADPERHLKGILAPKPAPKEAVAAYQHLRIECEESRHIAASAHAEWKDSTDFARWLSRGPGYEVDPKDIVVALVYENT